MQHKNIVLFADRLPPLIGGMEIHAQYFIRYFSNHTQFRLIAIITKLKGMDHLILPEDDKPIKLNNLPKLFEPEIIFFNSGRWIEELIELKLLFPKSNFIYRTGGNEILKASLVRKQIYDHSQRQDYWVNIINNSINFLITNSAYTESRLKDIGVNSPFIRCVGGVKPSSLNTGNYIRRETIKIFCAARFVPYKNHKLLISTIKELILRGIKLNLELAGDGPLISEIKALVKEYKLEHVVEFLGPISNDKVCRKIAKADVYMQFSCDQITEVQGGSYIHSEGMGRSILEAITAGTFIIAGNSGALPEIITDDRGLLIDIYKNNFIDKIEFALKKLPNEKKPINDFSWDNIFSKYEELFGSLQ